MRFLADMGISTRVVSWLRECGHDVVHLSEQNLHKLPDAEIFKKAISENRIILTFDLDFGEIVSFSRGQRASVVVFRVRNTTTPFVIERLKAVLGDAEEVLKEAAIVIVEESRHRIRRSP